MRGFAPGTPKPKNSGRRKGTPNKRSVLDKQAGAQGLKSAIEICRTGGDDPISIIVNASRFLNKIAEAFMPREGLIEGMDFREIVLNTPRTELDFMRKFLMDASALAYKAAEFGYAKLARIDHCSARQSPLGARGAAAASIHHEDRAIALRDNRVDRVAIDDRDHARPLVLPQQRIVTRRADSAEAEP